MPNYTSQQAEAVSQCDKQGYDNVGQYLNQTATHMPTSPYQPPATCSVVSSDSGMDKLSVPSGTPRR